MKYLKIDDSTLEILKGIYLTWFGTKVSILCFSRSEMKDIKQWCFDNTRTYVILSPYIKNKYLWMKLMRSLLNIKEKHFDIEKEIMRALEEPVSTTIYIPRKIRYVPEPTRTHCFYFLKKSDAILFKLIYGGR